MIPYGRQDVTEDDIRAVVEVLRSDFLTQGPAVPAFEEAVAAYCGVPHAVAANSATSALHLACLALDVGPGDRVWTSANTYVASANCARYCGADVDLVDIDPRSYNLSVPALEAKLAQAERDGVLPKAIIPVHVAGRSCDMRAIAGLAERYGFRVIEDASHAVGGRYLDEPVGRCRYSDITVFSFHPVKVITTGEGGMALTREPGLAERMARLRSHGITRESDLMRNEPDGPWYYEQIELGFNYRMTDLQAALGNSQLHRLDDYVGRRRALAGRYQQQLADLPLVLPEAGPDCDSAWHLYIVRLDSGRVGRGHRQVFEALRERGIGVNLHYIPVYRHPYYRGLGFEPADFPEAERYYGEALSLPLFPALAETDQDKVVNVLREALA